MTFRNNIKFYCKAIGKKHNTRNIISEFRHLETEMIVVQLGVTSDPAEKGLPAGTFELISSEPIKNSGARLVVDN